MRAEVKKRSGGNIYGPSYTGQMQIQVRWIATVSLCLSLLVISASIATRTPWWDEGVYADPAVSLATNGRLGSTVLGEHAADVYRPYLHQYTYWIAPFYPVALAAIFKIFGVGVFAMRSFSLFCALLALAGWYFIGKHLGNGRTTGLLASAVLALDFAFLQMSANGRPDAMVLGCGSVGLAAYLALRERNLTNALLAGGTFCALAVGTHPSGAIFVCDLVLLIGLLDRRRLRLVHALYTLLPFLVIGIAWLSYIVQAPEIFRAQFANQIRFRTASHGSRVLATITDCYHRYFYYYYSTQSGFGRLKIVGLVFYVAAFAGVLLRPGLRSREGVRAALVLTVANYCLLANLDRQEFPLYFFTVFAPFALVGAIWVADALESGAVRRWVAVSLMAASWGVSVSGHGVKILANGYKNEFLPVIERVKPIVDRGDNIVAGSEIAFGVGFRGNVIDDNWLGSGLEAPPEAIVFNLYDLLESEQGRKAALSDYQEVLSNKSFTLYARRSRLR
jgi:4-amino-4-deoxy-L-arabinose transferase-like glycosyltransferase